MQKTLPQQSRIAQLSMQDASVSFEETAYSEHCDEYVPKAVKWSLPPLKQTTHGRQIMLQMLYLRSEIGIWELQG